MTARLTLLPVASATVVRPSTNAQSVICPSKCFFSGSNYIIIKWRRKQFGIYDAENGGWTSQTKGNKQFESAYANHIFHHSCSVACNKVHRETHPAETEPAPAPIPAKPTSLPAKPAAAFDPSNPFSALDVSSDKFELLFRKYPELPGQLLEIHTATQPPTDAPDRKRIPASLLQGLPKKDRWNHDVGIKNGKDALRKARRADGKRGDGIREYCELIAYLMNRGDASTVLQRQATEQDALLVERLMAQEKR